MIYWNVGAVLVSLAAAFGVMRANPTRGLNRVFFALSLSIAAWLGTGILANAQVGNPLIWVRTRCAIGAFFPLLLWLIRAALVEETLSWPQLKKGWPWLVLGLALATLAMTSYFIPPNSTQLHQINGPGRKIYDVGLVISYLFLLIQGIRSIGLLSGVRRIEIQIILFGLLATAIFEILLTSLGPRLGLKKPSAWSPIITTSFYVLATWAVTTRRVLDARYLFREILRNMATALLIAALVYVFTSETFLPRPIGALLCAVAIIFAIQQLKHRLWRPTIGGAGRDIESTRAAILSVAQDPSDLATVISKFCDILSTWGQTESAHILISGPNGFTSEVFELGAKSGAVSALMMEGWSTPESVTRQRRRGDDELYAFMRDHRVGALVVSGLTQNERDIRGRIAVVVGVRHDRKPYTWPDILVLREWATVIEGACARAELTQQARQAEQLAMAGRLGSALAHEIRNPLISIKTIAELAATRYNDPDYRRLLIEIVPPELDRIEALVTGLMDLGKPRNLKFEKIRLGSVIQATGKLLAPKANETTVALSYELTPNDDELEADSGALRQLILNLMMNAIQAVAQQPGHREVRVATKVANNLVTLEVSDNGPGVAPEIRKRLFRPYASNKSSGMGLGLAVSDEIVRSHRGQISLVQDGRVGTTFRVVLPCQQPTF